MTRWVVPFLVLFVPQLLHASVRVPGPERKLTAIREAAAGGAPIVVSAAGSRDEAHVAWFNRGRFYVTTQMASSDAATVRLLPAGGEPQITIVGDQLISASIENGEVIVGNAAHDGVIAPVSHGPASPDEWVVRLLVNDSQMLVVVADRATGRMRARMLDPNGYARGDWIALGIYGYVAAGADPGGFLVLTVAFNGSEQELRGWRITNGSATPFVVASTGVRTNALFTVFDGTNYLVVLRNDFFGDAPRDTRGILVAPSGMAQTGIFPLLEEGRYVTAVAPREGGSLLFFGSSVVSVDHASRFISEPHIVSDERVDVLATTETRVLAIWTTYLGTPAVYGRWLERSSGAPLGEPFVLSRGTPEETAPVMALGRTVDLIVWQDQQTIAAARVLDDGTVLDESPLALSRTRGAQPAVTFDGTDFFVVWSEENRIVGRRVHETGLMDDAVVLFEGPSASPAVAHSRGTTLVVWEAIGSRPSTRGNVREIAALRVGVDSTPVFLSRDPWDHYDPQIAPGDGQFLVSWNGYFWAGHHAPVYTSAAVTIMTSGGTFTVPTVLSPLVLGYVRAPRVAWNGTHYLAVWQDRTQVLATKITPAGTPGTVRPVPIDSVSDAGVLDGSWVVVSPTRSLALTQDLDFASVTLLPMLDPRLASDGSRAAVVYRRQLSASPFHGSNTVLFRLYDHEQIARRRAVR
jgi:hypothetical protein